MTDAFSGLARHREASGASGTGQRTAEVSPRPKPAAMVATLDPVGPTELLEMPAGQLLRAVASLRHEAGGDRALTEQPWTSLQALAGRLLAGGRTGTLRRHLVGRLRVRPLGPRAFQGKPDRMLRFHWQLLTDLYGAAEQALGIRLLSDSRDTGRVRRFLSSSDPMLRAAALMSRFLPFAARRAFTGLSGGSATDQERYGTANAWELCYLARNPSLKSEELRALAARLDSDDPEFWPAFPGSPGRALASTEMATYVQERWSSREALRDAVLLKVIEHPSCPVDLIARVLRGRDPSEVALPWMEPVVARLMETTLGRSLLTQWHERYRRQCGADAEPVIREHRRRLLARSGLTQPELSLLFRLADVDDVLDAVARTRGRLMQQAHESARAVLIHLVYERAPGRLEEAWEAAKGSRMVAATMASLPDGRAKALASQQPELPAQFRRHLDRWALAHRDDAGHRDAVNEILYNLGAIRYEDQGKARPTSPGA